MLGIFSPKEEPEKNGQVPVSFQQEEQAVSFREVPIHFVQFSYQNDILILIAIYEENGKACRYTYEFEQDDTDDISDMIEFTDSEQARLVIKRTGSDEVYEKVLIPRNVMFKRG
jgi:hypothetical protein